MYELDATVTVKTCRQVCDGESNLAGNNNYTHSILQRRVKLRRYFYYGGKSKLTAEYVAVRQILPLHSRAASHLK